MTSIRLATEADLWFYARLSREIPGEEPMPNIASGIWARLGRA